MDGQASCVLADGCLGGLSGVVRVPSVNALIEGAGDLRSKNDQRADEARNASTHRTVGGEVGRHPAIVARLVEEVMGIKCVRTELRDEGRSHHLRAPPLGVPSSQPSSRSALPAAGLHRLLSRYVCQIG